MCQSCILPDPLSDLQLYCCATIIYCMSFLSQWWLLLTFATAMYDGSLKNLRVWQRCVYGWPLLCCRALVELTRCRLLTRPIPSSPKSSTALSRNISRHSTSESPFLTYHTCTCQTLNPQIYQQIINRSLRLEDGVYYYHNITFILISLMCFHKETQSK